MQTDAVLVERHDRVALVAFNRPERLNAGTIETSRELQQRLDEISKDEGIGAVVLTGAGRAFSAGANLKNAAIHTVPDVEEYLDSIPGRATFDMLQHFPKPILAAVNGYAIGGGFVQALCCDFIHMNEHAVFGLPQVSLGLVRFQVR